VPEVELGTSKEGAGAGFDDAEDMSLFDLGVESEQGDAVAASSGPDWLEEELEGEESCDKPQDAETPKKSMLTVGQEERRRRADEKAYVAHVCQTPKVCAVICTCRKRGQAEEGTARGDPLLERLAREVAEEEMQLSIAALEEYGARVAQGLPGCPDIPRLPKAQPVNKEGRPRARPFRFK
jgi:hypothetical protein